MNDNNNMNYFNQNEYYSEGGMKQMINQEMPPPIMMENMNNSSMIFAYMRSLNEVRDDEPARAAEASLFLQALEKRALERRLSDIRVIGVV